MNEHVFLIKVVIACSRGTGDMYFFGQSVDKYFNVFNLKTDIT